MGHLDTAKKAAAVYAAYRVYRAVFPVQVMSLEGKLAVVTGAASGVGRVLAIELARKGTRLVLWDVQQDKLEETKEIVLNRFPRADVRTCVVNLADKESIYAAAGELEGEAVDILINNAGVVTGKYFEDVSDERMELTMKVNAMAHMYTTKAFLPGMIKRNAGHIASVASLAGFIGASSMVDYATSKFAARGFSEALSVELYERGIDGVRVSCICPTLIDTGLFKGFYVPGSPTLQPLDVATAVVNSIEYGRELVICPDYLKLSAIGFKSLLELDGRLGIKLPLPSPMKDHDDSQAQAAFRAIAASAPAKL